MIGKAGAMFVSGISSQRSSGSLISSATAGQTSPAMKSDKIAIVSTAFDRLIAPLDQRTFFLRYWGKEHLICRGKSDLHKSLFSWSALSDVLSTHRIEYPRLRLLRGGQLIPHEQYITDRVDRVGNPYSSQDSQAVAALMEAGAMLHITSIGETWKPLATFAGQLEQPLCGRVQVNLHAGLAKAKGFHTHWDGHDVFAVQINGRKRWRLFGITAEAPLAIPPEEKRGAPTHHIWEGVLEPGDMLYLPRGYWHATQFIDDASLHLTFAVQHPTSIDFIQWLLKYLAENAAVRRDIPAAIFELSDIGGQTRDTYIQELGALLLNAISHESLTRFLMEYRATLGRVNHIQLTERSSYENR